MEQTETIRSQQEIKVPKVYERMPNFYQCIQTRDENTFVGRYTNHTERYSNLVKGVIRELDQENHKQKRSIEELVEAVGNRHKELVMKIEYVKSFSKASKFERPLKHVYLNITERRGIYSSKQGKKA